MIATTTASWPFQLAFTGLALAAVCALAGCGSAPPSPVLADAPFPAHLAAAGLRPCAVDSPGASADLPPGSSCLALVRAHAWQSRAGVLLQPGRSYRISAVSDQFWFDDTRRSVPPFGDEGSRLMNVFKSWKRHPKSQWFALIAAVGVAEPAAAPDSRPQRWAEAGAQDLSRDSLLRVSERGELLLYPNDAVAPFGDPTFFYCNNHGQIWVRVDACRSASDC